MKNLKISYDIYSPQKVKQAIVDYKDYATIKKMPSKNGINLLFYKCKYDESVTIKQFENYLIGLENS